MKPSFWNRLRNRYSSKQIPPVTPEQAATGLDTILQYTVKKLTPYAADAADMTHDQLQSRIIDVKLIDVVCINGYVSSSDNWHTFQLHINSGLMHFVHEMCKLFSVTCALPTNPMSTSTGNKIGWDSLVATAKKLLKAFCEGDMPIVGIHLSSLDNYQTRLNGFLVHFTEAFIISHELSHIVLKISPNEGVYDKRISSLEQMLKDRGFDRSQQRKFAIKWDEEFNADVLASALLCKYVSENFREKNIDLLAIACSELVFILFDMLELFYQGNYGRGCDLAEHPDSRLRLDFLRGFYQPGPVFQGHEFEQLASRILSAL